MVDLLVGLQALARGDAPEAEPATVDLAELVDAAVVSAAARHPGAVVAADLPDAPVTVRGWEPGLRLLVDNLVENAAIHGRRDGRVLVTLDAAGPVLHVDDDGPGVPEEERERIFAPFARVEGTGRPGSGLGLALVEQQARHHGATVTVGDAPLGGARFTVRF
jgi:two-component system, OmpR family, sensor histidine kinase PrrB